MQKTDAKRVEKNCNSQKKSFLELINCKIDVQAWRASYTEIL